MGRGPIAWLVIGVFAGYLARFFVRGTKVRGCVVTTLLGIAGSFVGGTLGNLLFRESWDLNAAGVIGSLVGAIIVLVVIRATSR